MTTGKTLIVGTRGSRLARAQTDGVVALLRERCPECRFEVRVVSTTGDVRPAAALRDRRRRRLHERARIRAPFRRNRHRRPQPEGPANRGKTGAACVVAAVTRREDPRDALVSRDNLPHACRTCPPGARIGTGSLRRAAQLRLDRAGHQTGCDQGQRRHAPQEGRIRRTDGRDNHRRGGAGAIGPTGCRLNGVAPPSKRCCPRRARAPSRSKRDGDDEETKRIAALADDRESRLATAAERAFLRRLGGGCRIPVAALGVIENGRSA